MSIIKNLRRGRKRAKRPPTYHDFMILYEMCSEENQKEYMEVLMNQPRPETLCDEDVPQNLNGLTYGQLDDMTHIKPDLNVAGTMSDIIFGKPLPLMSEDVNKVFGFMNFCKREIERINALFQSIRHEYSQEEKRAGIERLNFGSFGVLDWYAKRMGIANQNDVRDIAWVRIYQCMKNDNAQAEFEKRLQEVYLKK